jgi:AcrR family transcriptional regulator
VLDSHICVGRVMRGLTGENGRNSMPRPIAVSETSARILDVAERLVQMRGFNAFSYADVADVLKVTKASLHYHLRPRPSWASA